MASFIHARANNGKWLLRIDDLDTYRNTTGATDSIIETLQIFGLHWDDAIQSQTVQAHSYQSVINQLLALDLVYPCTCTRKSLQNHLVYPGICLKRKPNPDQTHALRIQSKNTEISFNDEIQGQQVFSVSDQLGDFIVKRKDNVIAYQLAVVVDDYQQNITDVIRGFDLLDSTPKQIFLQQLLSYPTPHYCHVPIITDSQGYKLSKQSFAQAVSTEKPEKTLFLLLQLLQQNPPALLKTASVQEMLNWAITHWQSKQLKKLRAINTGIY